MGLLETFAQFGLPGLVIGIQFVWVWRQERRLRELQDAHRAEMTARVEDAKGFTSLALELQSQVMEAVKTITDAVEVVDEEDA